MNVLGCTEQYSFCKVSEAGNGSPDPSLCSDLGGFGQAQDAIKSLNFSSLQNATLQLILYAANYDLARLAAGANAAVASLLASQSIWMGDIQLPIPVNQWKHEVSDWHATSLAMLQQSIVDYATGAPRPEWQQYIDTPKPGSVEAQLCHMIRARSNGKYVNISVLGMMIILSVSVFVLILNLSLPCLVKSLQRRISGRHDITTAWEADELCKLVERADRIDAVPLCDHHSARSGGSEKGNSLSKRYTAFF